MEESGEYRTLLGRPGSEKNGLLFDLLGIDASRCTRSCFDSLPELL